MSVRPLSVPERPGSHGTQWDNDDRSILLLPHRAVGHALQRVRVFAPGTGLYVPAKRSEQGKESENAINMEHVSAIASGGSGSNMDGKGGPGSRTLPVGHSLHAPSLLVCAGSSPYVPAEQNLHDTSAAMS